MSRQVGSDRAGGGRVAGLGGLLAVVGLAWLGVPDAQAAFKIRSARIEGCTYLLVRDVAAFYGMSCRAGQGEAHLSSKTASFAVEADRREARLNGVQVHLSLTPRIWKDELVIGESDLRLVLEPVLRGCGLPTTPPQRILIDPGHGGADRGTAGRVLSEKAVVLQVAQRLAQLLKQGGYKVYLTRTGDQAVGLEERAAMVRSVKADLFISLHCNAAADRSVRGIETYLVSPAGTCSTSSNRVSTAAVTGNRSDRANTRLAFEVQRNLVARAGATDRGVRHARFVVLQNAPCPAALVELGFMSNLSDDKNFGSAEYQQRLAQGLLQAVQAYRRGLPPAAK